VDVLLARGVRKMGSILPEMRGDGINRILCTNSQRGSKLGGSGVGGGRGDLVEEVPVG